MSDRVWRVATTIWAGLALAALAQAPGPPLQPLLVFPFVLVAPGYAATAVVRVGDRLTRATLSVVVSIVLATIVAQVLLAVGWWSPTAWLAAIAALTLAATWAAPVQPGTTTAARAADASRPGVVGPAGGRPARASEEVGR